MTPPPPPGVLNPSVLMATCADSISHKPRNPLSSVVTLGALYLTSLSILSAVAKPHTAYFSAKGF